MQRLDRIPVLCREPGKWTVADVVGIGRALPFGLIHAKLPEEVSTAFIDKASQLRFMRSCIERFRAAGVDVDAGSRADIGRIWACIAVAASHLPTLVEEFKSLAWRLRPFAEPASGEASRVGHDVGSIRELQLLLEGILGLLSMMPVWGCLSPIRPRDLPAV